MNIPNGMRNCGMRFTPRFDPIPVILINVLKPITSSLNLKVLCRLSLFELLKKAAEEKNARTSERMRDLVERGEHPWQQPEFIEETSKQMRDLVARGEHLFQQPEFIEENSKRARALVDIGKHQFQQPEFIEENSEQIWKGLHDKRKLSSGSTEEATYYAIDGADENGRFILIREIFGTKDLNFTKKVIRRNGKRSMTQFHTMEAIDELYL
jgi:hypothetical protein